MTYIQYKFHMKRYSPTYIDNFNKITSTRRLTTNQNN